MPDHTPPSGVVARLKRFDRFLDLRWCGEVWGVYRKGQRIGSVRPDLLGDGGGLIAKLHASDLQRHYDNSGTKAANEFDEHDRQEKRQRRENRKKEFGAIAREGYDHIARRTGRRVNSSGVPETEKPRATPDFVVGPASTRNWP